MKVGACIQAARRRARGYIRQVVTSQPDQAAQLHTFAAKALQRGFEALPRNSYRSSEVFELVMDVAATRLLASKYYRESDNKRDAAFELRHGAHCIEIYARQLVIQDVKNVESPIVEQATPQEMFREALDYRYRAIELFRSDPSWELSLAFELSYTSKTLTFLRENVAEFNTPKTVSRIINYRQESGPLFESFGQFEEANFEYYYLMGIYEEKAGEDSGFFANLGDSALRAARACAKGRLSMMWQRRSYQRAAEAFLRAARVDKKRPKVHYLKLSEETGQRAEEIGRQIADRRK